MTLPTLTDLPISEIAERLAAAVERSPADETSLTWIESRSRSAAAGDDGPAAGAVPAGSRVSVEARVRERSRVGHHRTGALDAGGLDAAVRLALGQARLGPTGPPLPMPGASAAGHGDDDLHDPAIAGLEPAAAGELLAAGRETGEALLLDWHELRLAVANSRGLARGVTATTATLRVRCGDGPGAGHAAASARTLAGLAAPRVVERARRRHGGNGGAAAAADGGPLLLAAEAVAALVRLFARSALSSRAVLDRTSFLSDRLGQRVFSPAFSLADDGGDDDGLRFPCDVDGWPKRRIGLVEGGAFESPAIDPELGRALGRTPTPHAVTADESQPSHLLVAAGEADAAGLLAAADGGLAIGALGSLVCHRPVRGRFRARARGVRRIEGGRLGAAVEDFTWEAGFEDVFGERLRAVGNERVVLASDGAWGGVVAPALVISG